MTCPDCQQLETDLRLTREALALAEAALAESQSTCERLRSQLHRIQRMTGQAQTFTVPEWAQAHGVMPETIYTWQVRYHDFPQALPGIWPLLYDRATVEDWHRRHPRVGKGRTHR